MPGQHELEQSHSLLETPHGPISEHHLKCAKQSPNICPWQKQWPPVWLHLVLWM
jgi:hypothetical protein